MDKKPTRQYKRKPLLVKLTREQIELDATAQQSLDRAFDILFDEVLKRRRSRTEEVLINDIDS